VPSPARGERELKLDVVEQSFHVLRQRGLLAILSPVERDQFYQPVLKKVFGHVALEQGKGATVFWSARDGDRKRRRHEVKFTAKVRDGEFAQFVSRPGVFAYGRLDDGSHSLLDVLETRTGDRIVDLGCGCGVVGIIAAIRTGQYAHLTMADSNTRAVAVAELNARARGLTDFSAQLTTNFSDLPARNYDLALANPPYFARHTITRLFVEQAHGLLRRGGRLYLVTRQLEAVEPILEEFFPPPLLLSRRNYAIMVAMRID
jgi:16S rRNA (guanine1207-N2)-methyltransferase